MLEAERIHMKTKAKKGAWFYKMRGSYLPCSWQGLAIYGVYLVYIVAVPAVWYQKGHDLWSFLVMVIPLVVAAAVLTQYIASKNAREGKR